MNKEEINIDKTDDTNNNDTISRYLSDNETIFKTGIIILTFIFLLWVWYSSKPSYLKQRGGNPLAALSAVGGVGGASKLVGGANQLEGIAKKSKGGFLSKYSKGLDKMKGGLSKVGNKPLLSSGFAYFFQFLNGIFMVIGIILILVLIPTIPIMIFLVISYFICRRKLWEIRTL
jgi:hypothetical protein